VGVLVSGDAGQGLAEAEDVAGGVAVVGLDGLLRGLVEDVSTDGDQPIDYGRRGGAKPRSASLAARSAIRNASRYRWFGQR
jgi:hypothetical protein